MKTILVIGSGGREFALVAKLAQDESIEKIVCSPGSAGMAAISLKVFCYQCDAVDLVQYAAQAGFDLTIVGPEVPLVWGIVNRFSEKGLKIVGPTRHAARLEGSKVFCKHLLAANDIPTAAYAVFHDPEDANMFIHQHGAPVVVKADGLAAGKGVIVAHTVKEAIDAVYQIMVARDFGEEAGRRVVIEDCLKGRECSVIALTDGKTVVPFIAARDYKPVGDGNTGPNTGGMGCFSPVPDCTTAMQAQILEEILKPTVEAMARAGTPYKGVLYAGVMLTDEGPKVLEFNIRFGDPETQPLLALLKSDLLLYLEATADGTLGNLPAPEWHEGVAVCLVLAAPGYPGSYEKGMMIEGIEQADFLGADVIHAGTAQVPQTLAWVTNGGRVLNLVARDVSFEAARNRVYAAADSITFGGKKPHYRTDIAADVSP